MYETQQPAQQRTRKRERETRPSCAQSGQVDLRAGGAPVGPRKLDAFPGKTRTLRPRPDDFPTPEDPGGSRRWIQLIKGRDRGVLRPRDRCAPVSICGARHPPCCGRSLWDFVRSCLSVIWFFFWVRRRGLVVFDRGSVWSWIVGGRGWFFRVLKMRDGLVLLGDERS